MDRRSGEAWGRLVVDELCSGHATYRSALPLVGGRSLHWFTPLAPAGPALLEPLGLWFPAAREKAGSSLESSRPPSSRPSTVIVTCASSTRGAGSAEVTLKRGVSAPSAVDDVWCEPYWEPERRGASSEWPLRVRVAAAAAPATRPASERSCGVGSAGAGLALWTG